MRRYKLEKFSCVKGKRCGKEINMGFKKSILHYIINDKNVIIFMFLILKRKKKLKSKVDE